METIGQNQNVWADSWKEVSIEQEIRMWDYYGLRPWILKYVPRYGKVLEAGCGLGRYVFLLQRFGIDIEGIDFSEETISNINKWQKQNGFNCKFKTGDITCLPYPDNSLRGYLSFGVMEHFIEGPAVALAEAYRVLEPGGIAIITTPAKSWFYYYLKVKTKFKNFIKFLIRKPINRSPFFQYWYSVKELKHFVEQAGFTVVRYATDDLLYTFTEAGNFKGENIRKGSFWYWFVHVFQYTFMRNFGAQSIVIAVKKADLMYCFLSGKKNATLSSLTEFDVPVSDDCNSINKRYYKRKNKHPHFHAFYLINPDIMPVEKKICSISRKEFKSDFLFENFGLTIPIHPDLLKDPEFNFKIANEYLQPIWRKRKI